MTQLQTGPLLHQLQTRPRLIVGVFLLLVWAWIGWQMSQVAFDRDLSETDLTSRQVRVQQEQLDQLTSQLQAYRQPTAVQTIPTILFVTGPDE